MADKYLVKWECSECFEVYGMRQQAVGCHGAIVVSVTVCEVCGRDWGTDSAAKRCCFAIANPPPVSREKFTPPRPIPAHLIEPDLGTKRRETY